MMENHIASRTGRIMSEAAQRGFIEGGGSVDGALQASEEAHATALAEWGSADNLAQAHGEFGTEMQQAYGPRSVISFTTSPETAKYFANGGSVYRAMIHPEEGIWESARRGRERNPDPEHDRGRAMGRLTMKFRSWEVTYFPAGEPIRATEPISNFDELEDRLLADHPRMRRILVRVLPTWPLGCFYLH